MISSVRHDSCRMSTILSCRYGDHTAHASYPGPLLVDEQPVLEDACFRDEMAFLVPQDVPILRTPA